MRAYVHLLRYHFNWIKYVKNNCKDGEFHRGADMEIHTFSRRISMEAYQFEDKWSPMPSICDLLHTNDIGNYLQTHGCAVVSLGYISYSSKFCTVYSPIISSSQNAYPVDYWVVECKCSNSPTLNFLSFSWTQFSKVIFGSSGSRTQNFNFFRYIDNLSVLNYPT